MKLRDKPQANSLSGVNGVYKSLLHHSSNPNTVQEFWAAFVPIGPNGGRYIKKFYITSERSDEDAFEDAVVYRRGWEAAFKAWRLNDFFMSYEEDYYD